MLGYILTRSLGRVDCLKRKQSGLQTTLDGMSWTALSPTNFGGLLGPLFGEGMAKVTPQKTAQDDDGDAEEVKLGQNCGCKI